MDSGHDVVRFVDVSKVYGMDEARTVALNRVSFAISQGEFVTIAGPSGSGKTTLLSLLGLLDRPSSGSHFMDGRDTAQLPSPERARLRRNSLGFVFQGFNLIGDLTVAENVELPLRFAGVTPRERHARVQAALEEVGIGQLARRLPDTLSGGQQQRAAIARAVVGRPRLLLADEPTGNLDSANAKAIMTLLYELNESGTTICLVTHEPQHQRDATRLLRLADGVIWGDAV